MQIKPLIKDHTAQIIATSRFKGLLQSSHFIKFLMQVFHHSAKEKNEKTNEQNTKKVIKDTVFVKFPFY